MKDLKKLAQQYTSLSELMQNREKIDTEDIIKYYKQGITIDAVELNVSNGTDEFMVYTFKEDNKKFAFGGKILQNIFENIIKNDYEGDIGEFSHDLASQGLKVRLDSSKTKKGLQVTTVEIL